jgi:protein disulfide-isomerase A1
MKRITLLLSVAMAGLTLLGCAKKESTLDKVVDSTKDALDVRDHEKIKDAATDAKTAAEDAAASMKNAAAEAKEQAKEAAKDATQAAKDAAADAKQAAKDAVGHP